MAEARPPIPAVLARACVADVSAVADPNTGVAVYDTYGYQGSSGWLVFGGTSVRLTDHRLGLRAGRQRGGRDLRQYPYSHTSSLNDVTSGSNGSCGST